MLGIYLVLLVFACSISSFAQTSALNCYVFDTDSLPAKATVVLYTNKEIKYIQATDEEGFAVIKPLPAGSYNIATAFRQGDTCRIDNVLLQSDKTTHLRISTTFAGQVLDFKQVVDWRHQNAQPMNQQDWDKGYCFPISEPRLTQ